MPIRYVCSASDPFTAEKAAEWRMGGGVPVPSLHPDAKRDGRKVEGKWVYRCPWCDGTFTERQWKQCV